MSRCRVKAVQLHGVFSLNNQRLTPRILLSGLLLTVGFAGYSFTSGTPYDNLMWFTVLAALSCLTWFALFFQGESTAKSHIVIMWIMIIFHFFLLNLAWSSDSG